MKLTFTVVLVVFLVDVYSLPYDNDKAIVERIKRSSSSKCFRFGRGVFCNSNYSRCEIVGDGIFCEGGNGASCMSTPHGSTCGPKCGCFRNRGCFCGDQCSCDTHGCRCGRI